MLTGQYLCDASILGRGNKVFANRLKENCKQKKKHNVLIKPFQREALLKNGRAYNNVAGLEQCRALIRHRSNWNEDVTDWTGRFTGYMWVYPENPHKHGEKYLSGTE